MVIKNLKIAALFLLFMVIFFIDFDNGITDYLFLAVSIFLLGCFFIPKNISDYIFIIVLTSYAFLFMYSVFWTPVQDFPNYFISDETLGYKLAPNINHKFDDNIRKGVISTNSLGHRDEEFTPNSNPNIVLLGDSMTFGHLVDQKNNLDKQIEQLCGNVNAHNLGVGGYGLPGITESYSRYNLEHTHAIYFFYINDLRSDNFTVHENSLVRDGYFIDDGSERTEQEIIDILSSQYDPKKSITSHLKLRYLFLTLKNYLASINLINLENEINYFPYGGYSDDLTNQAINLTLKLKETVESNNAKFTVMILPSVRSINAKKYPNQVQTYLNKISKKIETINPIKELHHDDYIYYDGHLSELGMKKIAKKICLIL